MVAESRFEADFRPPDKGPGSEKVTSFGFGAVRTLYIQVSSLGTMGLVFCFLKKTLVFLIRAGAELDKPGCELGNET